ncbi:MAG: glycosyltransferase family 4 protein [Xanthomonadales bacterium]|nr:glycosyltransferase family 4 protein [Xanthomonadales bacterium]
MSALAESAHTQAAILTAVLSFALTGFATWYSNRRGLLDHPGERSSHIRPTPRGGGAGLMAALMAVSWWAAASDLPTAWSDCVAPLAALLALLGWIDDHRPLSARLRFLVQLAVTCVLLAFAIHNGWLQGVPVVLFAGSFVLWMTNLYNFMDGSNGMAGTQGVFAGLVLAWLYSLSHNTPFALVSLLVAAACAGFLPWNLGQARVFMGDVGSLPLGFIFGALLVFGAGTGDIALPVALMVMMVFLADSSLTLLVRVLKREQWYNPHKKHLYQRMIARGWTHGHVLLFYLAMNLALVLPGIVVAVHYPASAWPLVMAMALVFGAGWYLSIKKIGVLA